MKIDELDEFQGLTREMVDRYLDRAGWCHMPDPEQRLLKPQYVHVSFKMGIGAAIERIASITGCAPQFLLREINTRMRKGMPSEAARKASRHNGGMWIASRGELGKGGTIVFVCFDSDSEDGLPLAIWDGEEWDHWEVEPREIENEWSFWPCDEHGNKVRWPEKDGVML